MVEVFKTGVEDPERADMLIGLIHEAFPGYKANFDLEDRDRILRVKFENGIVEATALIDFLRNSGVEVNILPFEVSI